MDKLISQQAAIDALRDYLVEKRCPDDGTLTCRLIENEVINKLPSVQPEQRWIPVSERLPEPWDLVLVTDRHKDVRVCQMHHDSSDGWYDEHDNWMYFSTSVLAWMSLPEYYQEKDGEQE